MPFAEYRKKSRMMTVELYNEARGSLLAVRGILAALDTENSPPDSHAPINFSLFEFVKSDLLQMCPGFLTLKSSFGMAQEGYRSDWRQTCLVIGLFLAGFPRREVPHYTQPRRAHGEAVAADKPAIIHEPDISPHVVAALFYSADK
jgi:hypothetical protein